MPFLSLSDIEEKEVVPGFKGRFVHTPNVTLAYWNITAGAELPEHSHHHEMTVNLIEGEFELNIDGQKQVMKPGMVAVVPSNVPHSGRAVSDCRIIDVFHPVREDYQ